MKTEFTKKEAAEVLGITPRTIHFYTDQGLIIPEKANPIGRGTTRKYSRRNLIEFLLVRELAKNGLSLDKIKNVMTELRGRYDANFLNPDGAWEKKQNRDLVKLIIYDAGNEKPLIRKTWKRKVSLPLDDYSSAIVVKVDHFFKKIRNI
ncbi:MAG: MerR family transcriptional regulator [Candidatus Methanoperedens sp.]|nr:MerR family transcriptional regulator [Candidatus Methanoperedens sp.]